MRQFIRKVKKSGLVFLSSLLLICFFSAPFFAHDVNETNGAEKAFAGSDGELSGTGGEASKNSGPSYLFIGNSKTFYNNLPEMYKNIVSAGTGEQIRYTAITYSGRSEEEHGKAIKAVGRTKGESEYLTSSEKAFFALGGVKDPEKYDEAVYQEYADALLDEDGNPKHYDYIVLQLFSPEISYARRKTGVLDILNTICDSETNVVLSIPMRKFPVKNKTFTMAEVQDELDSTAMKLNREVLSSVSCKSSEVALTGRAGINYLLYEGQDYAQNESQIDYGIYLKEDGVKVKNDLVVGDRNHPTQLGTYLAACVIYSTIYGNNAVETVSTYHAGTRGSLCNLYSLKYADNENYAMKNGSFISNNVLQRTADLAYRTQCEGFSLPLEEPSIRSVKELSNGVKITWNRSEGAGSFCLFRKKSGGEWETIANISSTSYTDTTVRNGVVYTYGVSSVAEGGSAIASNYLVNCKKIRFYRTPTLKSAQAVKGGVAIKWGKNGAGKYVVYRKSGTGSWKKIGTSATSQFIDRKVKAGTTYDYTVRAYDSAAAMSARDPEGIRIQYLGAPRVSSVSSLQGGFRVNWSKASEKVTGYEVQYSTTKRFTASAKIESVKGRKTITKKIDNLTSKNVCYVRVRSYKKVNGTIYCSAWSAAVKVKTKGVDKECFALQNKLHLC